MLMWLLLVGFLCSFGICNGRGVDANLCGYEYFNCPCGNSGAHVSVGVKECTYFHRWKPKCKPCKDLTEESVCPKYSTCAECHQDIDQCVTCPHGRYGSWCTNECSCQNGASCDKNTGQCFCPNEYEGTYCERQKGCAPPPPPSPPLQEHRQPPERPSTIAYSCPNNFVLQGASVSTCLPGGQWSNAPPHCQCSCQNGGNCDKATGHCTCPEEYEGTLCERMKGCAQPPPASPPVQEHRQPPERTITITYSCPKSFVLQGAPVSTCLPGGQWSNAPPHCLKACPLLSAPAHGDMEFTENDLIEGVQAHVNCESDHRLRGNQTLTCQSNGVWSSPVPICERLAICDDPGTDNNLHRTVHQKAPRTDNRFLQNTELKYSCKMDFLLMGSETILCLASGTWSSERPSCVKVPLFIPDCKTTGKDITAELFVPVRIWCPPECASETLDIWGTSIYQEDSSICKAAVHGGKITNSGGLVAVIKNGEYSHFLGSTLNNIQSQDYDDVAQSFRFRKLSQEEVGAAGCPKGMFMLKELCVYVSRSPRSQNEADAICTNLGLRLTVPGAKEEQKSLIPILAQRGIKHLWNGRKSFEEAEEEVDNIDLNNNNETQVNFTGCESSLLSDDGQLTKENTNCDQQLSFICINKAKLSLLASCKDPGPLPNGKVKSIGQINAIYYVGSSVQYTCERLHFMSGPATISCTSAGTWSAQKPTCIKVDTCEEPPVPTGGLSEYLSPLKTSGVQRTGFPRGRVAAGSRSARLPVGLNAELPQDLSTSTQPPIPEDIALPPGHYRIGTRAMYDCESRYYRLVGSRTRRCLAGGVWSGRPPTCIPVCGKSDSPRTPFVVNGNATDIGQWPWQAGLARFLPDYNRWFLLCGGSLLNERWVITAAHCVTYAATTFVIEPSKFRVYLGKYHRSDSKDDEYVQVKQIQEIHIHPDYDPNLFDADIALLHLDSPVQLNTRVQPVCLPTDQSTRGNLKEGTRGVVTGWGMNENGTYSDTLQQAVLPVVSHSNCEQGYEEAESPLTVTENMFCAGFKEGKADACSGDSGGPMVFMDNSSKEWMLEGIVSWGSPKGCGNPNQYGGFTTVHSFLDWIHQFF